MEMLESHERLMTKETMQPRQTLSYLQQLFRERGIRLKSKLGQNFLIDINLVDLHRAQRGADQGRSGDRNRQRHRQSDGQADQRRRSGAERRDRSVVLFRW